VKQPVENSKEQNIGDEDGNPEAEFHGDVLTVGGRRMMQSVTYRGSLVQARPVHRPAVICVLGPV